MSPLTAIYRGKKSLNPSRLSAAGVGRQTTSETLLPGTFTVRGRFERGDADERGERRHHCAGVVRELRFEAQQLHVAHVPNYVHIARGPIQTAHDQRATAEIQVGEKLFQSFRTEILSRRKKHHNDRGSPPNRTTMTYTVVRNNFIV